MNKLPAKSVVLIAGPTASGKSAFALGMARERNGVIINADSMQVYRELRILTARPSGKDERLAPHRLYGHTSGAGDYSVGNWLKEATAEIVRCWDEGVLPIVCGGTGLYFKAMEQGLAEVPSINPHVREKWRGFDGDIHAELQHRDPEMAVRLPPSDRQRITRALEVFDTTGRSLLAWQQGAKENAFLNKINVERHLVNVPREDLYARAERRFDDMLAQGALEEVRALPDYPDAQPVMKAIGVPELRAHLRGALSLTEAASLAKTASRHYIKRQLTWWRGQGAYWTARADGS